MHARHWSVILLWGLLLQGLLPSVGQGAGGALVGRILPEGVLPRGGHAATWVADDSGQVDPSRFLRPPYAVIPLAPDGSFRLVVPPGRYFVGAIVRIGDGPPHGPPLPGDLLFAHSVEEGSPRSYEVGEGDVVDVGTRTRGAAFTRTDDDGPLVCGRVLGEGGEPTAGVVVGAFSNPRFAAPPRWVSPRSGEDGSYCLPVGTPGTYFLGALSGYSSRFAEGRVLGRYGGAEPAPVHVAPGARLQGIDLIAVAHTPERPPTAAAQPPAAP